MTMPHRVLILGTPPSGMETGAIRQNLPGGGSVTYTKPKPATDTRTPFLKELQSAREMEAQANALEDAGDIEGAEKMREDIANIRTHLSPISRMSRSDRDKVSTTSPRNRLASTSTTRISVQRTRNTSRSRRRICLRKASSMCGTWTRRWEELLLRVEHPPRR